MAKYQLSRPFGSLEIAYFLELKGGVTFLYVKSRLGALSTEFSKENTVGKTALWFVLIYFLGNALKDNYSIAK